MFERLRNFKGPNTYPQECGGISVTAVRDLTTGFDSNQANNKAVSSNLYRSSNYVFWTVISPLLNGYFNVTNNRFIMNGKLFHHILIDVTVTSSII